MLADEEIEAGKAKLKAIRTQLGRGVLHEHPDCIRMSYEWLDAQAKRRSVYRRCQPLKHIIEKWAGRYVSQNDVEVAALLHPDIIGVYPRFNISARLTLPSERRLYGIGEARKHTCPDRIDLKLYTRQEP